MNTQRFVYLLDHNESRKLTCTVTTTKLMKWEAFSEAHIEDLSATMQARYKPFMRDNDKKILMRLMLFNNRKTGETILDGKDARELAEMMIETGRAFWLKGNRVRIQWGSTRPAQSLWSEQSNGRWLPQFKTSPESNTIIAASPPLYIDIAENVCGPLETPFPDGMASRWASAEPMADEQARLFSAAMMNRYSDVIFDLPESLKVENQRNDAPIPVLEIMRKQSQDAPMRASFENLNTVAQIQVSFKYGPKTIPWDSDMKTISFSQEGVLKRLTRQSDWEASILAQLKELGLAFDDCSTFSGGFFNFDSTNLTLQPDAPKTWSELIEIEFPKLRQKNWHIHYAADFQLRTLESSAWYSDLQTSNNDWFEYDTGFCYAGTKIQIIPIIREFLRQTQEKDTTAIIAALNKTTFTLPIHDGRDNILIPGNRISSILQHLFELFAQSTPSKNGRILINHWRAAELAQTETLAIEKFRELPDTQRLVAQLQAGITLKKRTPTKTLNATLRDYQKEGLDWLQFLREHGINGILADDMGLGKTIQTIAHLLYEQENQRLDIPALIIAPTSLLDNWSNELKKFAPSLKHIVMHGPDRKQHLATLPTYDVIITTYRLLQQDLEDYCKHTWAYVILDESQFIKNASTQAAQAIFQLASNHRLCLTGTPLENNYNEIWSLFNFLMPGFLGSQKLFKNTYIRPIERGDPKVAREFKQQLQIRLAPFMLRRKKEAVAKELPAKTEIIRPIELSAYQSELYESIRMAMHDRIVRELEKRGLAQSHIIVLDALLKLRQICCDPRLVKQATEPFKTSDSAKLKTLLELLQDLKANGHKVLLFSQFTSMLSLIENELPGIGVDFIKLTGATQNRGQVVDTFQTTDVPLMLLSLKAGGTGLNLTQADTVIHYDPWWNPAVEAQATDRAHRIGQDKPVFVYKLIAENTVESKILELQEHKKGLLDDLFGDNTAGRLKLDEDEVADLFAQ